MFNKTQFDLLHQFQNSNTPCVSIFIPTYRSGSAQEDRIRLKNAISEATTQLTNNSTSSFEKMDKNKAVEMLAPAHNLLEDEDFWSHLSEGLAIFIGENHFSYFVTPLDFPEFVYVHDHFYLRHMVPLLNSNDRFFVLALSQNEVRFFEGSETSITPIIIEDLVPSSIEEMIGSENNTTTLQAHGGGGGNNIYHGQGAGKDDKNEELKKYFRRIDDGLMEMLHDEKAPMVIYSVEAQIPIYQEISKYSNIYNNHITGNPESDDPVLIHEKTWSVVKDFFKEKNQTTKNEFNQNLVDGKGSFSIHEITPAAVHGKVETLFIDKDTEVLWGAYDEEKSSIQLHEEKQPNSICLLNKTVVDTFQNGGSVSSHSRAELPRVVAQVNAIFRY